VAWTRKRSRNQGKPAVPSPIERRREPIGEKRSCMLTEGTRFLAANGQFPVTRRSGRLGGEQVRASWRSRLGGALKLCSDGKAFSYLAGGGRVPAVLGTPTADVELDRRSIVAGKKEEAVDCRGGAQAWTRPTRILGNKTKWSL